MKFYVLTLFPEMITNALSYGVVSRGVANGAVQIECVNIRDYALNKHARADDYPYGGGVGMVMTAQPVYGAYLSVMERAAAGTKVVYMTPQGKRFDQRTAAALS